MALWARVKCLSCVISHFCWSRNLSKVRVTASHKTCNVDLGVMHEDKAVVCFHPTMDTAFELTKAIPRHDPIGDSAETHNLMLKSKLSTENVKNMPGATTEELSQMFYTTKHCWYPVGEYHSRRRNRNPLRER